MRLYIIRHGETSWNVERKLQGQKGADLNEKGIRLAEITRDALKDIPFDLCITSPALRARHTAEIIMEGRNVPVIEDERLIEISFGEWEGKKSLGEDPEIPPERFRPFFTDSWNYIPPEGGESIRQIIDRSGEFLDELLSNNNYRDKTIMLSSHGCAVRALLHFVYEDNSDFWHGSVPPNCAVSIVDAADGKMELIAEDQVYYEDKFDIDVYFK
ncbi:MAG TPA: phosphoglycerate mutase [Lachnospiraceae bacterium]|nr:phosphoglycerate mutase [Lachnospiraceae bacterium]